MADLPLFLQRPDTSGSLAKLTYQPPSEKAEDPTPRWRIAGSPMVLELAYKLFSNVARGNGFVSFPAVPPTFGDLLMLQHRFPTEVGPSARTHWEEFYAQTVDTWLLAHGTSNDVQVSSGGRWFLGQLLPFQEEGVRFMKVTRRALLADDMGLGKTPQALAFLSELDEWPAAIIVQPHVIPHWKRKIGEFLEAEPYRADTKTDLLTWIHLTGKPNHSSPHASIYLLHYLAAFNWDGWLKARGIKVAIFDEAQELRHQGTKKYDACKTIARAAPRVAGLSGTPIYNRGDEIYRVLDTLNRGCLGSFNDFKVTWCDYDEAGKLVVKEPRALGQYLTDRNLVLRRTKDEVMSELPDKRRVIEPLTADNALFAELVEKAGKLARNAQTIRNPFDRARMEAEAIAQTRRATGIAKVPAVVAFLRGLMEAEEPTLVFAHHHDVYDSILSELDEFAPVAITGRETLAVKDRSQQAFVRGDTNLCLISLRAATGLDGLQERARVVVFAELDWSPAIHRQAEDRAHRHGQRSSVLAYYLVTDVGTDPHIMGTINIKDAQFTGLMQEREVSEEDLRAATNAAEDHKAQILATLRKYY